MGSLKKFYLSSATDKYLASYFGSGALKFCLVKPTKGSSDNYWAYYFWSSVLKFSIIVIRLNTRSIDLVYYFEEVNIKFLAGTSDLSFSDGWGYEFARLLLVVFWPLMIFIIGPYIFSKRRPVEGVLESTPGRSNISGYAANYLKYFCLPQLPQIFPVTTIM